MALNVPVTSWTAIIPVRSLIEGKSRLDTPEVDTAALAAAFLTDLIAACSQCKAIDQVVVVSPDPAVHTLAAELGARAVTEGSASGINAAIEKVRSELPEGTPVVAILGDTPSLGANVLDEVLASVGAHATAFVPDTAGTGSTLWCSTDPKARSHFGVHSRAKHRQAGAFELGSGNTTTTWARARRDVDTAVDLWDATRLGVGPATGQALA